MAILQIIYADFRPVFLPEWPAWLHSPIWAYLFAAMLIFSSILIIIDKEARTASIFLGWLFLLLFLLGHVPYTLFVFPHSAWHVGVWVNPLKELALSGGAFVLAGNQPATNNSKKVFGSLSEKLIPLGRIFFAITMFEFGYSHFLYVDFVTTLVPSWIPGNLFWTYAAGIFLMGSGICIMFKIKLKLVALLTALMLFTWFVILHIPRAIADPLGGNSNEVTSVFQALAFSGIALGIAILADAIKMKSSPTVAELQPSI
jgi:uncharacterized membrane protein YphA (DoxX/SURF4 family)